MLVSCVFGLFSTSLEHLLALLGTGDPLGVLGCKETFDLSLFFFVVVLFVDTLTTY